MSVLHYVLAYVLALNQVFAIYLETYQDANFTCKTIIKGVKLDNRKPLTVSAQSACGGDASCCSLATEKKLKIRAGIELYQSYIDQMKRSMPFCFLLNNRQIEDDFRLLMTDYTDYIRNTLYKSICHLNSYIYMLKEFPLVIEKDTFLEDSKEEIIRLFFDVLVDSMNEKLQNPDQYYCIREYILDFAKKDIAIVTSPVLQHLARLKILVEILKESKNITQQILGTQKLTKSCKSKLMKMLYCSKCKGYDIVKPCRSLCLETVVSCLSFVEPLIARLDELYSAASVIVSQVRQSDGLVYLTNYIYNNFIPKLESNWSSVHIKLKNCRTYDILDRPSFCHSGYQKAVPPLPNFMDRIASTIRLHSSCLGNLLNKLEHIPEALCKLSSFSGRVYSDWNCWTGSNIGRYDLVSISSNRLRSNYSNDQSLTARIDFALAKIQNSVNSTNTILSLKEIFQKEVDSPCQKNGGSTNCILRSFVPRPLKDSPKLVIALLPQTTSSISTSTENVGQLNSGFVHKPNLLIDIICSCILFVLFSNCTC